MVFVRPQVCLLRRTDPLEIVLLMGRVAMVTLICLLFPEARVMCLVQEPLIKAHVQLVTTQFQVNS